MIPNPWVLLGLALAWVASLVVVGAWQREDGATGERSAWQRRENAALLQANATIDRLNTEARAREKQHANDIAHIGADHAKDRETLEARRRADVAAARDGSLRLRVAGACPASGDGAAPASSTTPGGSDDATTGELPGPIAAALLDLVNEADGVVQQLTACQAVILADRKESP